MHYYKRKIQTGTGTFEKLLCNNAASVQVKKVSLKKYFLKTG
jgi:hypothetical protein